MNKVTIFSDSTCDLNPELLEKYNIKIIPLYVVFDQESYKDMEEINDVKLYQKVEETKKLPKTSATPIGDFTKVFENEISLGNDVLLITISSFLSSTYQNALAAKELVDSEHIEVIDSLNLSTSIGLLAIKAAKYRDEGLDVHQIKDKVQSLIKNSHCKFAIESLEYLHKGGRCSGVSRLFGTLLQLKPVIIVKDGKMDVDAKPIGKKKALNYMLNDIINNKDIVDQSYIMVTHTFAHEDAKVLVEKLTEVFPNANIEVNNAGSVISSHCGKGTIGILYLTNE